MCLAKKCSVIPNWSAKSLKMFKRNLVAASSGWKLKFAFKAFAYPAHLNLQEIFFKWKAISISKVDCIDASFHFSFRSFIKLICIAIPFSCVHIKLHVDTYNNASHSQFFLWNLLFQKLRMKADSFHFFFFLLATQFCNIRERILIAKKGFSM